MASVTGITAERAEEIWNASVVSGVINQSTGRLELMTRGGTILDGGSIVNPSMQKAYPVGSIYMNVNPANPATLIGFGTWVRWAVGRMPIGVDPANPRYDASEEAGGAERVTLAWHESGLRDHAHNVQGNTGGSQVNADMTTDDAASNPVGNATIDRAQTGGGTRTITGSNHAHFFNVNSGGSGNYDAINSHENMPPFVACYIWKRTA
jgi:hypothetical protein